MIHNRPDLWIYSLGAYSLYMRDWRPGLLAGMLVLGAIGMGGKMETRNPYS